MKVGRVRQANGVSNCLALQGDVIHKTAFGMAHSLLITARLLLSDNRILIMEHRGHAPAAAHGVVSGRPLVPRHNCACYHYLLGSRPQIMGPIIIRGTGSPSHPPHSPKNSLLMRARSRGLRPVGRSRREPITPKHNRNTSVPAQQRRGRGATAG